MNKTIEIENEKYQITLDHNKQLSFSHVVQCGYNKNDSFGFTFDENDISNQVYYDFVSSGTSKISPFVVKTQIMNEVVHMINTSKTNFFYFTSTTYQKGRIYANVINKLLGMLNGDWSVQNIYDNYFYFSKSYIK